MLEGKPEAGRAVWPVLLGLKTGGLCLQCAKCGFQGCEASPGSWACSHAEGAQLQGLGRYKGARR